MNAVKKKLISHYKLSEAVVDKLINKGIVTPAQMKAATDQELLAVVNSAELADIKTKIHR